MAHARIDFLDVAVDDHDRVVHDHAQRHDERGERHRVQFHAAGIEDAQRDEYCDRDGARHACHAHRQQQHDDHDDGDDGDEQFLEEVHH